MKKFVPAITVQLAGLDKPATPLFNSVVDVALRLALQSGEPIENKAVTEQAVKEGVLSGSPQDHKNQTFISYVLNRESTAKDGMLKKVERGVFDVKK